ncbi:MAG: radical SAM protein [Deltaproteobacteria bacterium]|nr:radical SAM protein [Deltaproteobacteria bacterium]
MTAPRFANLLFSGRCNLRCPHCIGRQLPGPDVDNLELYPPKNLDLFCHLLRERGIRELSLTGTNTDPLLYRHLPELIAALRRRVPEVRLSLHSNGLLVLPLVHVVNRCHRLALSLPSFDPDTCLAMTGRRLAIDLELVLQRVQVPVKVSTLVTPHNLAEIPAIVARCRALGVRRMALRRLYGDETPLDLLPGQAPVRFFGNQPVYDCDGMEVTVWRFEQSALECLNLFADGFIGDRYLLAHNRPPQAEAA